VAKPAAVQKAVQRN